MGLSSSTTKRELPVVSGFGPATGPSLKTALCHIGMLVGRRINTAPSKCKSGLPWVTGMCRGWWKQNFRLRLWSLVWFRVRATSCHLTSSKSAWKSTPKCTWMCWRVWQYSGAIRWPVADSGCGSRTRCRPTSPKRPRLGFRRSAMTLYPFSHWPPSSPDLNPLDYFVWLYVKNITNMTSHNTKASLIAQFAEYSPSSRGHL